MSALLATLRRELGSYFTSVWSYAVLTVFLLLTGAWFWYQMSLYSEQHAPFSWEETFGLIIWLMTVIVPFVTAPLLAEERHRGTIEALFTAPIREWQIVVAKLLAAVGYWLFLLLCTVFYALLLSRYSTVDWGQLASAYLGVLLAGACLCSLGLLVSGLAPNQLTAGVVTFILCFGLAIGSTLADFIGTFVPGEDLPRILRGILAELNWMMHLVPFLQGIIDLRHAAFFLGFGVFFTMFSIYFLESRRWR